MDIAKLKLLLESPHPVSGDWDVDDTVTANQFNAVDCQRIKPIMSGDEVFAATVASEFLGVVDHKQLVWMAFCGRETINPSGGSNVALVNFVFGEASATLTALAEARKENVSFAVKEGLGTVRPAHVSQARAYHV